MATLMFKDRFADKVASGEKRCTIRPTRKRPIKVGEHLSLRKWAGKAYRSKQILLGNEVCASIHEIKIEPPIDGYYVHIDGKELNIFEIIKLSKEDGFEDVDSMIGWSGFVEETHGLPFTGTLIRW